MTLPILFAWMGSADHDHLDIVWEPGSMVTEDFDVLLDNLRRKYVKRRIGPSI